MLLTFYSYNFLQSHPTLHHLRLQIGAQYIECEKDFSEKKNFILLFFLKKKLNDALKVFFPLFAFHFEIISKLQELQEYQELLCILHLYSSTVNTLPRYLIFLSSQLHVFFLNHLKINSRCHSLLPLITSLCISWKQRLFFFFLHNNKIILKFRNFSMPSPSGNFAYWLNNVIYRNSPQSESTMQSRILHCICLLCFLAPLILEQSLSLSFSFTGTMKSINQFLCIISVNLGKKSNNSL